MNNANVPSQKIIERDPLVLIFSSLLSAVLIYVSWYFLKDVKPAGFIVMIPAVFFSFHTIWLFLNPLALITQDRMEVRQLFFRVEFLHFRDIMKLSASKRGKLYVTYHDGETEPLDLKGIRRSHLQAVRRSIEEFVLANPS